MARTMDAATSGLAYAAGILASLGAAGTPCRGTCKGCYSCVGPVLALATLALLVRLNVRRGMGDLLRDRLAARPEPP